MDKIFRFSIVLFIFFILFNTSAFAKEQIVSFDDIKRVISGYGCQISIQTNTVTFIIDERSLFQNISKIKEDGFMRNNADEEILYSNTDVFAGIFGFLFVSMFTIFYYDINNKIDNMHYLVKIKNFDAYGQPLLHNAYSLDFNRTLYKKVDWGNFDWRNMPKIAKNVLFSSWYNNELNELIEENNKY